MKKIGISVAVIFIVASAAGFILRPQIRDLIFEIKKTSVPRPEKATKFGVVESPDKKPIPESINLDVPFMVQAPTQNWDLPYQESCEEAAMIMLSYFDTGKKLSSETADKEIHNLTDWEITRFGDYKDTDAEQNKIILSEYFKYKNIDLIYDFTVEDIKKALIKGRPVLIPMSGRELKNPFYKQPGPVYHMLLIKGFMGNNIITNDSGTKRGKDYIYTPEILLNAAHDWNNGNVSEGKRVMILASY